MASIAACCSPAVQMISIGSLTHPSTLQHLWPYDFWLTRLCLSWDALVDRKDHHFLRAPCTSQITSPRFVPGLVLYCSGALKFSAGSLPNFKNAFHCSHVTPEKSLTPTYHHLLKKASCGPRPKLRRRVMIS